MLSMGIRMSYFVATASLLAIMWHDYINSAAIVTFTIVFEWVNNEIWFFSIAMDNNFNPFAVNFYDPESQNIIDLIRM